MKKLAFLPLVASVCLLATSGCGVLGPSASDTVTRTIAAGDADQVSISGFNGSIKVRQGAGTDVEVIAKRTAQGQDEQDAKANLDQLEVETLNEDGKIVVRTEKPSGFRCGIAYEITIPAKMQVIARTSNGSINVEADGTVLAESSNGSITVAGTAEQVTAKTSNGSIKVNLESVAKVDLKTSNASVNFLGSLAAGGHPITTSNGSVNVTIRDTPAQVNAKTSNGRVRLGETTGKSTAKALLGNTESAEAELEIKTSNASVNVDYVVQPKQESLIL